MLNPSIQPGISNPVQAGQIQGLPKPAAETQNLQRPDEKAALRELSMAVSSDIYAEYGAISRLNDIFITLAKTAESEKDPDQKQILETRLNTINQMILQREMKINRMDMTRSRIEAQLKI